jgi:hypothetical protein
MINHMPVVQSVNVNGRYTDVLDMYRLDSQLNNITSDVNVHTQTIDGLRLALMEQTHHIQRLNQFMEFYFQTMPTMRDAFNAWKIAQKAKERVLNGHSDD